MKLHLPSSLRKALLACLAALALPSFTLSLGSASSLLGGAVVFSFLAAESSYADFNPDPTGGWGETEDLDASPAGDEISFGILGTKTTTIHGKNITLNFNTTATDANFKLDSTSTGNAGSVITLKGSINVANAWLTTSSGGYGGLFCTAAGAETLFSGTRNIYVNGAQLWFRDSGATDLRATFHIGASIRPEDPGLGGALRFSHDVSTSGKLDVMEDATITFQESKTFSVSGLSGNGALTLSRYLSNIGTLELAGTGGAENGNFGGALTVPQGTRLRVNIGNDNGGWQTIRGNVNIDGDLEFEKGELDFTGESVRNINGALTSTGRGKITLQQARLNFNPYTDSESTLGGLDIGNATANILRTMKLTDRGLRSRNNAAVLNVGSDSANVTLTIENTQYDGNNGQYSANLNIFEGSTLVKRGSAWQSLTGATTINGSLVVEEGTLLLGNNNMTIGANGSITVNRGATLAVNTMAKEKIDQILVGGSGSAYAALEWTGGGGATGLTIEKTRGLKLVNNNDTTWSTWTNCNILTEVELKAGQFVVTGTTTVGRFVAEEGDAVDGQIVVEWSDDSHNTLVVGGAEYGESVSHAFLKVGKNAILKLGSNLTISGIENKMGAGTIVSQENQVTGLTINNGTNRSADVSIDISGNFTKNGAAEQKFSSSLTVGGDLVINDGALTYDSNGTTTSVNVTGELLGNGGEFRVANKTATFGRGGNYGGVLVTSWGGAVVLGGDLTVKGLGVFQTAVNNGGDDVFNGNIGAAEGTNVNLIINGGAGTEGTTTFSRGLTVAENVHLIKQGVGVQRMRQTTLNGALSVNEGTMLFDYGASTLNGELGGTGGTLQVRGEGVSLALNGGGDFGGSLLLADAKLILGGDFSVASVVVKNYDNKAVTGTGLIEAAEGKTVQFIINGGGGTGSNMHSNQLEIANNVTVVKKGSGTQKLQGANFHGNMVVNEGTMNFTWNASQIDGRLTGNGGTVEISGRNAENAINGQLTLLGGGEYNGEVRISNYGTLVLGADLQVGNLTAWNAGNVIRRKDGTTTACAVNVNVGEGTKSMLAGGNQTTAKLTLDSGVTLEKSGAGTWQVHGLTVKEGVTVSGGTLEYIGGGLSMGGVTLQNDSTLRMGSSVADGTEDAVAGGALTVAAGGGNIAWGDGEGVRKVKFDSTSGSGTLNVGELSGSEQRHRAVELGNINNYNGSIVGSTSGSGYLQIGSVSQSSGKTAKIEVTGGVHSNGFAKTGDGTLNVLTSLTVSGSIRMDYEGELKVDDLNILNQTELRYTTGSNDKLLTYHVNKFIGDEDIVYTLNVDKVFEVNPSALEVGIDTGIVRNAGQEVSDKALASQLQVEGGVGAAFYWGGDDGTHLYLKLTAVAGDGKNLWDANWGLETVSGSAPTTNDLEDLYKQTGLKWAASADSFAADENATLQLNGGIALLADGPDAAGTQTRATVMGGKLYVEGDTLDSVGTDAAPAASWIYLKPSVDSQGTEATARYHMLVGGSSCVGGTSGAGDMPGFYGKSHIQMEGGEVDYIIGGNHVTNSTFVFWGKTYVSVFRGQVNGGIVGGSTITCGSPQDTVHEFNGSSFVGIYTVLGNGQATPGIDNGATLASGFTAVVGGNAWVDLPNGSADVNPSFNGYSSILIDLVSDLPDAKKGLTRGETEGNFDKAIVGGNYTTSFVAGEAESATRSSTFTKSKSANSDYATNITIRATEGAVFTAGVNGASRRGSGGNGNTIFTGAAKVNIEGGTYTEAVAGGFWFEETSDGDHSSTLEGTTSVTISDGVLWRVVGGSYSLGGGKASQLTQTDSSTVTISGGRFISHTGGDSVQTDMGFVAGGNFYRNNAGENNVHNGLSSVKITGGEFKGIHIVGGDYANFSAGTGCAASITGGTSVSIGGGRSGVTVQGLVVGGSYLTDEAQGGSVSVSGAEANAPATKVMIADGAQLEAETAPEGGYRHAGIAVVGGSVIMDEGALTGGHTATVTGGSVIQLQGGSVTGHIVGGSYANRTAGQNKLTTTGENVIKLSGGVVKGNVYGGHYSDNTAAPDELSMGAVSITLEGADVQGDIVGGSYRNASKALTTAPTLGDVQIDLQSGRVTGNVYAAGWHDAADSVGLKATATSTEVTVSADVIFGAAGVKIVSGGFHKASANDNSTVTGAAALIFSSEKAYNNLANVAFRDFNSVTTATDVTLSAAALGVLDSGAASKIAKNGAGTLTLSKGLAAANGGAYAGKIIVNDGVLALGADQSLLGGLGFDLSTRVASNTKETAYLQGVNGAKLVPGSAKVSLDLSVTDNELGSGTYYLTGELEGVSGDDASKYFAWDSDALSGALAEDCDYDVAIKDGCLVLRVFIDDPNSWYWQGDEEGQVWDNNSDANWSRDGSAGLAKEEADVHFNDGAATNDVRIAGAVTPRNVFIDSGSFTFEQDKGEGGLKLREGGKIIVGDENGGVKAELDLRLKNTKVPGVVIYDGGKLTLSHSAALQESTTIEFKGGVLAFAEDASGKLLCSGNYAGQVSADSTDKVRIQVGAETGSSSGAPTLTWGGASATRSGDGVNQGIALAFSEGLVKTGRGTLNVSWKETDATATAPIEGSMEALAGKLTLNLNNEASGAVTISSDVTVADGATVEFLSKGAKLDIASTFAGADGKSGLVIIGSKDTTSTYRLSGDNSGFTGVIELRGGSSAQRNNNPDVIEVSNAAALGGDKTTLRLSGRHIAFDATDDPTTISAGTLEVTGGTVNYMGGIILQGVSNRNITITGAVTGKGTLANAIGGYAHTITGDITDFTGTLVAGSGVGAETAGNRPAWVGDGGYSSSSWTLTGAEAPAEIKAGLAGIGSVVISYGIGENESILLTGAIGGYGDGVRVDNSTQGKLIIGGKKNTSTGALIFRENVIQLGDSKHEANWAGNLLHKEGSTISSFVLANGSLGQAIEEKNGVKLVVDTAESGRVRVAGTQGGMFDSITVANGGRLSQVEGDIIVGSGEGEVPVLHLGFDGNSIGTSAASDSSYLIQSNGGNIDIASYLHGESVNSELIFDFDNEGFVNILKRHRSVGAVSWLHVLAGGGTITLGDEGADLLNELFENPNYAGIVAELGFKLLSVEKGDLLITGSSKEVYLALDDSDSVKGDPKEVTEYQVLNKYKATVVDAGQTLTVCVDAAGLPALGHEDSDGLHINNLVGLKGSKLLLRNAGQLAYDEQMKAYEEFKKWFETLDASSQNIYRDQLDSMFPEYGGDITIVLNNSLQTVNDVWALPDNVTLGMLQGIDTYFEGVIEAEAGVHIVKTGTGTLFVGSADGASGGITSQGKVVIKEGGIELRGAKSSMAELHFAYTAPSEDLKEDRAFTVRNGQVVITDLISDGSPQPMVGDDEPSVEPLPPMEGDVDAGADGGVDAGADIVAMDDATLVEETYTADDTIRLEDGGELIYTGAATTLKNLSITSSTKDGKFVIGVDAEGNGSEVTLRDSAKIDGAKVHLLGGHLTMAEQSTLDTRELNIESGSVTLETGSVMHVDGRVNIGSDGELNLNDTQGNTLRELTGAGVLSGRDGSTLTYTGERSSVFSGTLKGEGATLYINRGKGKLTFHDVTSVDSKWDIINDGNWVVEAPSGRAIHAGIIELSNDSTAHFVYNPNFMTGVFIADSFSWGQNVAITIESSNDSSLPTNRIKVGQATEMQGQNSNLDITLKGLPFLHFEPGILTHEKDTGMVYLELKRVTSNAFLRPGMHKNARAGATLFWAATEPGTEVYNEVISDRGSDLYKMSRALTYMLQDKDYGSLERSLAAGAGASVAVLGSALTQDLQRQLNAVRNRTTTSGADAPYEGYANKPLYNVWLNAEGAYHKLGADGLAPGFSLSSWGGSVGVDVSYSSSTSVGLAVSALYGNLKSSGSVDSGQGDLDTTYITLFARKQLGAWQHTLVLSGGLADVSFNRTVNYGSGSYKTKGSTDGNMLGALYEVGYSKVMNAAGTVVMQGVFNVEVRHTQISGYDEKASDAALRVDDIKQNVVTFGAGVRTQAVVGANAWNRSSIFEGRLLVKCDVGDNSGTATTRLLKGAAVSAEVEGAEIGAMGIEIGAGLTVPVGENRSALFLDLSAEFRSGYTNLDANVGYKVSF